MGSDLTSATFQHFSRMEFSSSSSARQPIQALLAHHKHGPGPNLCTPVEYIVLQRSTAFKTTFAHIYNVQGAHPSQKIVYSRLC